MRNSYERETIINLNESEDTAYVYTCSRTWRNRLNKLAQDHPNEMRLRRSTEESDDWEVPKRWIKVSPPRRVNMTDEQRAQVSERLRNARSNLP